jgi:glycosyltransferase involved in cell wall biosynthesis
MSRNAAFRGCAVLHLISSLEVGGAERLLIDFVKSCAEAPEIPQVVVVMNKRIDQNMVTVLNSTSVPVYYLGRSEGSRNPRYILELVKIMRKHRISVIHSHTPGAKYWAMLCRVLNSDLKLVHTFHQTLIRMDSMGVLLHNSMIDVTIAISRAVAKETSQRKIRRVEIVENGIPISMFRSVSPQPLISTARIITVGRLCPDEKGQDVLIRAVKRCVSRGLDVECTFVGSPAIGDFQTLPMLEALTASLQLGDRVHFVQGRIDVATLLAGASIFVLPSRREGFGLALVEAMAAGLPVIASNIEGPADILTDGLDGLLFDCGSDEQLAEKMAMLIQSPALADELRNNAREKSLDYDISAMREKYMDIYRCLTITE